MAVVFKNNAKTTLSAGITSSATSITVTDGSVFPSLSGGDVFFLTLDDLTNNEIVKCTAISGNTLTVVRAQEGTTARAFSANNQAELRITAGILGLFSQTDAVITDEIEAYLDANGLTFPDNVKGQFGSSNDLQIYHNGTDSVIDNLTGDLYLTNKSDDKDIILRTDNGSGGFTEYLRVDGNAVTTFFSKNTRHTDNIRATFGNSSDLQIYHDGSNSYIWENGTGNLILRATDFRLQDSSGNSMAVANSGGGVGLYHNASIKLDTTASGIDITGELQADTLDIDGISYLTSDNDATPLRITRSSASTDQAGVSFNAGGNTRFFGKGTDDEPYWATSANLTGGSKIVTAGNFTGILDSTYYQSGDNISVGTINSGNITATQLTVDDITINGSTISDSGNFTINAAEIRLDSDSAGVIRLKDSGTEYGKISQNSNNLRIFSSISDGDILLQGNDGGSTITALTLDMSAGGKATFNSDLVVPNAFVQNLFITSSGTSTVNRLDNDGNTFYLTHGDGSSRALEIHNTTGNVSISSGSTFQIAGVNVIDTSRNLVNIGTISSGAITSTGNSRFNGDFQVGDTLQQNAYGALQVNQTSNVDEEGIAVLSSGGGRSIRIWVDETNSYINSGNGGSGNLIFNEAITVSSGGNLTGVGTISSGAITSSGLVTADELSVTNDATFNGGIDATGQTITSGAITSSGTITSSNGTVTNVMSFSDRGIFGTTSNHPVEIRANGTEAIRIDTSQRVGIGTTSPDSVLHVKHASTNVVAKFESGDNQVWINLNDDGGGTYGALLGHDSDAGHMFAIADNSVTKRFVIDGSGNVGIGSTSPSVKLQVNSGTTNRVAKFTSSDGTAYIQIADSATTATVHGYGANGNDLSLYANESERIRIKSGGDVGIGTNSPSTRLHVNSGATNSVAIFESTDSLGRIIVKDNAGEIHLTNVGNDFAVRTSNAGSTKLTILGASGNVGIGEAAPAAKLHVAGDIRLSDNFIDFKSGGNAVNPQFKGKREDTTSLSSRAFTDEGGFSYTTFADEASDAPTGATNNANGLITMNTHGGAYVHQLAMTSSGNMYHRYNNGGSLSSWSKIHKGGALTDVTSLTMSGDLAVNTNNLFVDVSAAKVGIGTASPAYKLDVVGKIKSSDRVLSNVYQSTSTYGMAWKNSAGTDNMFLSNGGDLCIGNTSAGAKLDIRQDSGYAIRAENGSGHYFRVAATGQVEITNNAVDGTASLLLNCTENSQNASPILEFNRDSASPADADYLGQIKFTGENDNDQSVLYSKITGKISDASDTTEDGIIEFMTKKAGANNISMRLGPQSLQLINGTGLTVAGDATITGDLTVNGTTTTLNTATLDVEDKNITLNYSSSDSSGSANGAGITIQDAVSAGNDATILWDASSDRFDFSHPIEVGTLDVDVITNASGVVHLNDTLYLQDNSKAVFGDSSDLQIYHNGSHSNIQDTGTGNLRIAGSVVEIAKNDFTETMAKFTQDGASELYHNGSVRLTTQAAGIKVNSAQVGGINAPTLNIGQLNNAYQSGIESSVHTTFKTTNASGNFYFYRQNTIQASIIDGNFGIGQTTVIDSSRNLLNLESISMPDSKKIKLGAGDDLQLFHNGSSSVIRNDTGHLDIKNGSNDADIRFMCDDGSGGEVTYMTIDGSHSRISVAKEFIALDNVPLRVGSGGDAEFKHDGSNTYLINKVGDFYIQNTADDKDIVFQSDNGAGGVQTYFSLDGSAEQVVFEKSARFTDNDKAIFGTGSDLEIYHDGSNSYIKDGGTGTLRILSDDVRIMNAAGTEISAQFIQDGEARLKYDNATKLATKSTGIDVTGSTVTDGITLTGTGTDNDSHQINFVNGACAIARDNNDLELHAYNAMVFGVSNTSYPTSTERMRITSAGNVGINETSPASRLHITGTDGGWDKHITIEYDGSDIGKIVVDTDGMKFRNMSSGNGFYFRDSANATSMIINSSGNVGIGNTSPDEKLVVTGNIRTTGGVKVGDSSADALHFQGILKQGSGSGTTVMDSSRNLTNIGTISSGAITTSGAITAGAAAIGNTGEGHAIGHQYKKEYWYDEIVGDSDGSDNKWTLKNSSGSDLATTTLNHVYRVRLVTLGTGTNTGSVWLADNVDGNGWRVKAVSVNASASESSNYPKLEIDNNVPKVSIEHTSNYTIRIFVEEYNTGNSGGMYTIFGTDSLITYRDNGGRIGINKENPAQKLDVNGTIGINGTEIITTARNLTNIGSISSGAITSGAITSSGSITSGGTLTGASSELLRRTVSGWTVPTQTVLGSYYGSNIGDYIYLKVPGNSTNAHGVALVTDNAFYYGRDNRETGQITNDATSPLNENTGFKVTYDGDATFAGDVGIGTTSANGKLDVFTGTSGNTRDISGMDNGSITFANASSGTAAPVITGKSNNNVGLILQGATNNSNTSADMHFNVRENDGTDFSTTTTAAFKFQRYTTDLMTILRDGKVGIGTSAPATPLHILGTLRSQMDGNAAKYINLFGGNSGNFIDSHGNALFIRPSATTSLATKFLTDGTVTFSGMVTAPNFTSNGDITISEPTPKLRLTDTDTGADSDISGSSSNGSLFLSADTNDEVANTVLAFQVDGATKAYIGTDGLYTQSGANSNKILDNSTRNLTNIGTISSGAIASSGTVSIDQGASFSKLDIGTSRTGATENIGAVRFLNASDTLKAQVMGTNDGKLVLGTNGNTDALTLDASQNATFEGNITATTGDIQAGSSGNSAFLRAYYGTAYMTLQGYGLEMNRTTSYIRPSTDGNKTLYVGGVDASLDWAAIHFRSLNGLYMTGTRFLTTDRNLENIGTISSGNITVTTSGITSNLYGNDLIFNRAGPSYIRQSGGGSLLFTTSTSNTVALTLDASQNATFASDVLLADSKIIKLGAGLDLQIYHNGTDSFINNDTGTLFIKQFVNDGDIKILSDDGSGNTTEYIRCDGGLGQVKLFHYGSEKFITTSAGVKVTGEVNLTGELEINGTDVITSSRNLVNIGTISSTDFTTNGAAVVVQNKNLTILNQPVNISSPNNSRIKFLQTTSGASATKGSIQWFDSNSNSCGTIRVVGDGVEDNSGKMEFFVTAQTDELGDDPFGINKMMTITENGVQVHGSLSKSSGSFRIDHPLKPETHDLVHSFVEGPQADNLYRGVIKLENGRATVDLDEWFDMTAGTFLALNRDIQAFVNNSETWDAVRAKVMGSQLVIECQNPESNAEVSWLVIGERQDKEIHESALTNDNGKIIVEPEKVG